MSHVSPSKSLQPRHELTPTSIADPGVIEILRSRSRVLLGRGFQSIWPKSSERWVQCACWLLLLALLWLVPLVGRANAQALAQQHKWQMGNYQTTAMGY